MSKNELSIPETKPKPRKEDVIKALVVIARQNHQAAVEKRREKLDGLCRSYEKAMLAFFRKNQKAFSLKVNYYGNLHEIEFKIRDAALPASVMDVKRLIDRVPTISGFDEAKVKAAIRDELTENTGVQSLLESVEFKANADAFLSRVL